MRKIKKFIHYNDDAIRVFFIVLVVLIVILSNFLRIHYAQDTYCVFDSGYRIYARHFMYLGRPVGASVMAVFGLLNIPIKGYLLFNSLLSVLALSLSIVFLFYTLKKLLRIEKKDYKQSIILLSLSFITVLNFCMAETLVFAESGIFSFGFLCAILAACLWIKNGNKKYIYIVLLGMLSVFCHQSIYNIYIPIALLCIAIKYASNIKKAILNAIGVLISYAMCIAISTAIIRIINILLAIDSKKLTVNGFEKIIETYKRWLNEELVRTFGIGFKYWYIIFAIFITIIFLIYLFKNKREKIHIFYYFSIMLSTMLLPILPLVIMNMNEQYLLPRMAVCFGASIGIFCIYLFSMLNLKKMSRLEIAIGKFMLLLLVVCHLVYFISSSTEMIATNLMDKNYVDSIINRINEYETQSGISIKNIGIDWDSNMEWYYHNQLMFDCLNFRSLATDWAIVPMININSGKKFNRVDIPVDIHQKYFEGKNWTSYDEQQLVFEKDTLYICIY